MSNLILTLLQRKCFKNRINPPRPSPWDSSPTIHWLCCLPPSRPPFLSPHFVPSIWVNVLLVRLHSPVWDSIISCSPDLTLMPPCLWWTEWQEQGVIASKQSRLSEPLTSWSKGQSCVRTVKKLGDTWSLISKENRANWRVNDKLPDNQLILCLGSSLFELFYRNCFKLRKCNPMIIPMLPTLPQSPEKYETFPKFILPIQHYTGTETQERAKRG